MRMTAADLDDVRGATVSGEGARTFNHVDAIWDVKDIASITAVTVYTCKISTPDGEEELILDVAIEYSANGTVRQTGGPYHAAESVDEGMSLCML